MEVICEHKNEQKICQSCGMPLESEEVYGTAVAMGTVIIEIANQKEDRI